MNLQHVNIKIFVDGAMTVDPERFIEVFHRWIAERSMDEMLIDVADYRHVPSSHIASMGYARDFSSSGCSSWRSHCTWCSIANPSHSSRSRSMLR